MAGETAASDAERMRVAVRSDIHHLVQPVIGHMRMFTEGRWEAPTREQMTGWVERLYVALAVVDALGDDEARAELASKCGLGYATTPEADARNAANLARILEGK